MRTTPSRTPRGISLIEALVAMAVMAFGMLGVVGMQATLRGNADLSKQRTEAMRIAQERMEGLRSFSVRTNAGCPAPPAPQALGCKISFNPVVVPGYTTNTQYNVRGTVTPGGNAPDQTLTITVEWTDRAGALQSVNLVSAMASVLPELAASLVVSPQEVGSRREPAGRRQGIPPQAKDFGDGTSGFRPPQPAGAGVIWVFNNVTGLITSVCNSTADNSALTLAGLTGCVNSQAYQLISGYLRASSSSNQPTVAEITNPIPVASLATSTFEAEVAQTAPTTGIVSCFHGRAAAFVEYYCAVPVISPTPTTWSGTLRIKATTLPQLSTSLNDVSTTNVKVCRYRALTGAEPNPVYVGINAPLANENLVLMLAGNGATAFTCPNPPTRAHQPNT